MTTFTCECAATKEEIADINLGDRYTQHFQHDCSGCVFIEAMNFKMPDGSVKTHDIYYCDNGSELGGDIVARYGDKDHEYRSTPVGILLSSIISGKFPNRVLLHAFRQLYSLDLFSFLFKLDKKKLEDMKSQSYIKLLETK